MTADTETRFSQAIRQASWSLHESAEGSNFMRDLMEGRIDRDLYAEYVGQIYCVYQALEAAGYNVSTDLNLGSEQVALKALENGDISGYPEYTSTALTSFFNVAPEDVPADAQAAVDDTQDDFAKKGLVAFAPTPFADCRESAAIPPAPSYPSPSMRANLFSKRTRCA